MLLQFENKNIQFVVQMALSIATFGGIWVVNNQAAIVTALAIIIVYAINIYAKLRKVQIGRGWLTVIVYLVSLVMAWLLNPVALPALFPLPGDPPMFFSAMLSYVTALVTALTPYAGAAMAIYNILLKQVLDQMAANVIGQISA